MELTITQKHENKLLKRVEVQAMVSFEGATPSNADLQKAIAAKLLAQEKAVLVQKIDNLFGLNQAKVTALAYSDEKSKESTTPLTKHMKKKLEEELKKAAEEKKAKQEAAKKAAEEKKAQEVAAKPATEGGE